MSRPISVLIVYNLPSVPVDDPAYASEAGVLDSVDAFSQALVARGRKVDVLGVRGSMDALGRRLDQEPPDVVVNFCESFAGRTDREAHVAAFLELREQAFTGSPSDCLALVRDKAKTKWLLRGAGLPTADFLRIDAGTPPDAQAVETLLRSGTVIVKPAAEDASLGIGPASVAETIDAALRQVADVHAKFGPALVEQYLPGREFNVGVLSLPESQVLPVAEVVYRGGGGLRWPILTYDAKWDEGSPADLSSPVVCPAEVGSDLSEELQRLALKAAYLVGFRDYTRVDFRLDAVGRPQILEVNGNPDFGPSAGLARAVRASGRDYGDVVDRLVETVAARSARVGSTNVAREESAESRIP